MTTPVEKQNQPRLVFVVVTELSEEKLTDPFGCQGFLAVCMLYNTSVCHCRFPHRKVWFTAVTGSSVSVSCNQIEIMFLWYNFNVISSTHTCLAFHAGQSKCNRLQRRNKTKKVQSQQIQTKRQPVMTREQIWLVRGRTFNCQSDVRLVGSYMTRQQFEGWELCRELIAQILKEINSVNKLLLNNLLLYCLLLKF